MGNISLFTIGFVFYIFSPIRSEAFCVPPVQMPATEAGQQMVSCSVVELLDEVG